ncbi:MAG: aminotransferase class I/II-fold pyridoxal phosphate-dependent enzyme [SAR324 cluster bacterium]|nr:aminotransferase class I/II-fold pyridoxal phosphate-dependent enzyme [SAR324 cluster bacterium]
MPTRRSRTFELSPIKEIEIAAARVAGAVSLAQGIPDFDTPAVIKDYVVEKMAAGEAARYSLAPGLQELREQVAESLAKEGMHYDPDGEILITAGAIEAIAATLFALTEPGQEVIIPSPSYASYQQVIRLAGCEPRFAPLDEERNFDLDVEAIARQITPRTAAIFYCHPNNPTGTIYSREQSLELMALAERHGLIVITDEVYRDFCYAAQPPFTPAQEAAFRGRVVRIFSFSKAYAMTGWRVGYLHAERSLVSRILKAHDSLVTCAPVISQHAAMAALAFGGAAIGEFRAAYRQRRDLMLAGLDGMSHIFDYQKPDGAYFVFPRVKDPVALSADSRALALDLLHNAGVAVVPGVAFGPTGESHLRLSFGRSGEDIELALGRLRDYFERPAAARSWSGPPREGAPPPSAPVSKRAPAPPVRVLLRRAAVAYLQLLARLYLWRRRPGIVAIAGNRGKTVMKRVLTRALEPHFRVRSNPRSYNTEIGLPLAVLGLEIDPRAWHSIARTLFKATLRALFGRERLDWLVLELGARRRGDLSRLLRVVRPDWVVVTHLSAGAEETDEEAAELCEELGALCRMVGPERTVVSADDPLLHSYLGADPRGATHSGPARMSLNAFSKSDRGYRFRGALGYYDIGTEVVGASAQYAIQAAVIVAEQLGLSREQVQERLTAETGGITPVRGSPAADPPPASKRSAAVAPSPRD